MVVPILILAAIVYARGSLRTRPCSGRRVISFALGLICTGVAMASPLASFDHRMLTGHMVQHLLLMTLAAPLIWLGAPVLPLLHGLPFAGRVAAGRPTRLLARALGRPIVCWLAAAVTLVLWHIPRLLQLGMESTVWHSIELSSFLASGLMFWWPVIGTWPGEERRPRWSMLLYLFLATLPCDVLAGLLVFSDRTLYPVYVCTPREFGLSALEDQQLAGALMWTWVTIVFLAAGTGMTVRLLSPEHRGQARISEGLWKYDPRLSGID